MSTLNAPTKEQFEKYDALLSFLKSPGSAAIAFSGGVDSAFLLYAAKMALGENVTAITASSRSFPEREFREAKEFCENYKIRQELCFTDELKIEGFAENPPDRCYLCKREIFRNILALAEKNNIGFVAEGSNIDDCGDYRPGLQAIAELGVKSPLKETGFTKEDIRVLSRHFNLPTWNKQSFACLSTRFVYGETITEEKLTMVDRAEQLLIDLGFHQLRVRIHGMTARIEVMPDDFTKLVSDEIRNVITSEFKKIGFDYVTMDLTGYRTGSMNEVLK